jgi:hypothetical protein
MTKFLKNVSRETRPRGATVETPRAVPGRGSGTREFSRVKISPAMCCWSQNPLRNRAIFSTTRAGSSGERTPRRPAPEVEATMTNLQTHPARQPSTHLRECIAAWIVAATLVLAMASSSLIALLFENWT